MRRFFSLTIAGFLTLVSVGLFVAPAFAQVGNPADTTIAGAFGLGSNTDIRLAIINVVRYILGFLGLLAVLIVLYGGYVWMTAAGNAERIQQARRILINGLIGLLIILSAFVLVTYAMRVISNTVTNPPTGTNTPGDCETPPCGVPVVSGPFRVTSFLPPQLPLATTPENQQNVRNSKVTIKFNYAVDPDPSSISDSTIIVRKGDVATGTVVEGTLDSTRSAQGVIVFTPAADCPPPDSTRKCFDADSTYSVEVKNSIKRALFLETLSCTAGPCTYTFDIGNQIDNQNPGVSITQPALNSAPLQSLVPVQARGTDNKGVGTIQFSAAPYKGPCDVATNRCSKDSNMLCTTDDDCTQLGTSVNTATTWPFSPFDATASWDTNGYVSGDSVELKAVATDMSGNTATTTKMVTLRPLHCFDNQQNHGETGVDCGGDPNSPDYCGACTGQSCNAGANQCSENQAQCGGNLLCGGTPGNCTCQSAPIITGIDPGDGAPGNYVTITGRGFGVTPGVVTFLGAESSGDDRVGIAPAVANCPAGVLWRDNQIVIELPNGFVTGPVEVKRSDEKTDRTDGGLGPLIPDFVANEQVRPSLACITADQGKSGDVVTYRGKNFSGSGTSPDQALFGNAAGGARGGSNGLIEATVPNILPLTLGGRVKRVATDELSNPVNFTVLPNAEDPRIDRLSPDSGPVRQYVTILGANFGSSAGKVTFVSSNGTSTLAAIDFPAQCDANSIWKQNQILVKVPAVAVGDYSVVVERAGDKKTASSPFVINTDPLTPGICLLDPNRGPIGVPVDVYGENFGNGSGSRVTFSNDKAVNWSDASDTTKWNDVDSPGKPRPAWGQSMILGAKVPAGSQTGPTTVTTGSGTVSNDLQFSVGSCSSNAECDGGTICCSLPQPDGTVMKACTTSCTAAPRTITSYRWKFTTGNPAPRVVEQQSCIAGTPLVLQNADFEEDPDGGKIPGWDPTLNNTADHWQAGGRGGADDHVYVFNTTGIPGFMQTVNSGSTVGSTVTLSFWAKGPGTINTTGMRTLGGTNYSAVTFPITTIDEGTWKQYTGTIERSTSAAGSFPLFIVASSGAMIDDVSATLKDSGGVSTTQSPSPWKGSSDACENAAISVRFTEPLDPATVCDPNANAIVYRKCTNQDCAGDDTALPVTCSNANQTLQATPTLERGATYQATVLASLIRSAHGVPMRNNYVWRFTVGQRCAVKSVSCQPANAVIGSITSPNNTASLSANLQAENCNILTCTSSSIQSWALADGTPAGAVQLPSTAGACTTLVTGTRETTSPAKVTVTTTSPGVAPAMCSVSVKLEDFRVVKTYPSCQAACTNAEISATFNVPVNSATVLANGAVKLEKCAIADCSEVTPVTLDGQPTLSADGKTILISPVGPTPDTPGMLEPTSHYRVRLLGGDAGIRSIDNKPIQNVNFVADGVPPEYRWSFRTDAKACEVDRLVTAPKNAVVQTIGATKQFQTTPWSAGGGICGSQPLNAFSINYGWTSIPSDVATITMDNVLPSGAPDTRIDPIQRATAVGTNSQCSLAPSASGGASNSCSATVTASTDEPGIPTKTDSGVFTLQCGFKPAGRCVSAVVQVGSPGDANCDGQINETDAAVLAERLQAPWTGPDIVLNDVRVTNEQGVVITQLPTSGNIIVSGGVRNIGNQSFSSGFTVQWRVPTTGFQRGPGQQPSITLGAGQTSTVRMPTVPSLGIGSNIPAPGTAYDIVMEIQGGDLGQAGEDGSNNAATIRIDAQGRITLPGNKTQRPASNALGRNECRGLDVDGNGIIEQADVDALQQKLASGGKFCSNNPEASCEDDSECRAIGQCGGGTPNGTCLTHIGVCSNDLNVSCLVNGVPDNRACAFAVNTSGCCAARPWVESVEIAKDDHGLMCRNTAFVATFNTTMNAASVKAATVLERTGDCSNVSIDTTSWWQRVWKTIARYFGFFAMAARPDSDYKCTVPAKIAIRQITDDQGVSKTRVIVYPTNLLETGNHVEYRLRIEGDANLAKRCTVNVNTATPTTCSTDANCGEGNKCESAIATSALGVPMAADSVTYFDQQAPSSRPVVGSQVCAIAQVNVEIEPPLSYKQYLANPRTPSRPYDIFSCAGNECICTSASGSGQGCRLVNDPNASLAIYKSEDQDPRDGNQHIYVAKAVTKTDGEISASFSWSRGQGTCKKGIDPGKQCTEDDECGAGGTCVYALDPQGLLAFDETETEEGTNNTLMLHNVKQPDDLSKQKIGLANVVVRATSGEESTISRKDRNIPITVYLCQKPWTAAPWQDTETSFLASYCLDTGTSTPLPDFTVVGPLVASPPLPTVLREWILKDPTTGSPDAIGVRVVANPRHLSPAKWYDEQRFPKGSPSAIVIDGYPAIRDGRTVYIGAGNVVGDKLYTNMYIFSYNQDAKPTTINIFNQIVNSLVFNINQLSAGQCLSGGTIEAGSVCLIDRDCSGNAQCTSAKASVAHDVRRLSGLLDIAASLEEYRYGTNCKAVTPGAPGDADCNGKITGEDVLLVRAYQNRRNGQNITPMIQMPANCTGANYNGDKNGTQPIIDESDINATIAAVQASCTRPASATTNYPSLDAGSYIQGVTTSRWPSWSQNLGATLNQSTLPVDPQNAFAACNGYNGETCWSENSKQYACADPMSGGNLCKLSSSNLKYPPAVPVSEAGRASSVYTYTAYGICDKQRDLVCLFDSDCAVDSQDLGPCRRGEQYALCGFLNGCYRPVPGIVNQAFQGNRFCQVTSNGITLPPAPVALCPANNDATNIIPPLPAPPSHSLTIRVVNQGGASGTVEYAIKSITTSSTITVPGNIIEGTPVRIVATPEGNGGATWSGCQVMTIGITKVCTFTMGTADKEVTVTFTPPAPTVTISPSKTTINEAEEVTLNISTRMATGFVSFTANGISKPLTGCLAANVTSPTGASVNATCTDRIDRTTNYVLTVKNSLGIVASGSTVVYVNQAPTIGGAPQVDAPPLVQANVGQDRPVQLTGRDLDGCANGTYTYKIVDLPQKGTLTPATGGPLSCEGNALSTTVTYRASESGSFSFSFQFSDGTNLSSKRVVNISVP